MKPWYDSSELGNETWSERSAGGGVADIAPLFRESAGDLQHGQSVGFAVLDLE
jgi:hypothetical protein